MALVPCEDGHAQERSLTDAFVPLAEAGQLWVADRYFCTTRTLVGWLVRRAYFLVRSLYDQRTTSAPGTGLPSKTTLPPQGWVRLRLFSDTPGSSLGGARPKAYLHSLFLPWISRRRSRAGRFFGECGEHDAVAEPY